jgi:hypothetical protein
MPKEKARSCMPCSAICAPRSGLEAVATERRKNVCGVRLRTIAAQNVGGNIGKNASGYAGEIATRLAGDRRTHTPVVSELRPEPPLEPTRLFYLVLRGAAPCSCSTTVQPPAIRNN